MMRVRKLGPKPKKNINDQFYTDPDEAKKLIEKTINIIGRLEDFSLIVEPSAGTGAFLQHLPEKNSVGYDIEPKHPRVTHQNFYNTKIEPGNILVIGNPPFGRVCADAIKFFNHASTFAIYIAFIIPRTFQRISIQNRLNLNFHLIYDEDIDGCIFTPPMAAKCCYQIWEKRVEKRNKVLLPITHTDWEFVGLGPLDENNQPTPPKNADFAIRAYGGKVGDICETDLHNLRPKSWHWIKTADKQSLIEKFKTLDYSISTKTVRQNSLGRAELVKLYSEKYDYGKNETFV